MAESENVLTAPSAPAARPRDLLAALPLLAVGVWLLILSVLAVRQCAKPLKNSVFPVFAEAGQRWLAGQNVYQSQAYRYSPTVAGLLTPLAALPLRAGAFVWLVVNAGVFFWGLRWWVRAAVPRIAGLPEEALLACVALLAAPLCVGSFNNLQANPLVIGLMLAAVAAAARERFWTVAGCIALATFLKVVPLALGLVLLVLYPKRLSWRLALALVVGAALPFVLQRPAYVWETYHQWIAALGHNERWGHDYRDVRAIWEFFTDWTLPPRVYQGLQALTAAGIALMAAALWGTANRQRLPVLLGLVVVWIMTLGPSTESSTYILLAPVVAWGLLRSQVEETPLGTRVLFLAGYTLEVLGNIAIWFPMGKTVQSLGVQPVGALLVGAGLLAWFWGRATDPNRDTHGVSCP